MSPPAHISGIIAAICMAGWMAANAETGNGPAPLSFQASGILNHTNFLVSGAIDSVINEAFRVVVEGNKVCIRTESASNVISEWSYDGTNDYLLTEDGGPRAAAVVYQNEYPISVGPFIRTIWLGLGSAHYLGNPTNEPIVAPFGAWGLDGMLSYKWNIEPMTEAPSLPVSITFVASEALWQRERSLRVVKPARDCPFREGFIGGQFTVKATNDFRGLHLPSHFTLERYRIGENEGAVLTYTDVRVTNISAAATFQFRPRITRETDISDMRNSTTEKPLFGIIYRVTTDDWWAINDPRRLAMIEQQKPVYESWRRALVRKSYAKRLYPYRWLGALALVVGSVVAALICFRPRPAA